MCSSLRSSLRSEGRCASASSRRNQLKPFAVPRTAPKRQLGLGREQRVFLSGQTAPAIATRECDCLRLLRHALKIAIQRVQRHEVVSRVAISPTGAAAQAPNSIRVVDLWHIGGHVTSKIWHMRSHSEQPVHVTCEVVPHNAAAPPQIYELLGT
jgi:hypothetical protein